MAMDYNRTHHGSHFSDLPIAIRLVPGGTAGDISVSGITTKDSLMAVEQLSLTVDTGDGSINNVSTSDLLDEFTIASDGTINNDGGTDTSNTALLVMWIEGHPNS